MTSGRESSDRWARYAHQLLDRVRVGQHVTAAHVDWALAYLGDTEGHTKIPPTLTHGNRLNGVLE